VPAKKTTLSKSDFIRSQHAALSAAEVVAKGKAAGMAILPGLVYEVRRTARSKRAAAKRTSATPKNVTMKPPVIASKADFVRARAHLSPKEVVEDAKAAGIKFDARYVYNVRAYDRTGDKRKRVARATTARQSPPVPRPINSVRSAEELLKAVASEIGLGRAIELLQGERARVHSILRG